MLKIGEFSRICQVTVKTLRYYDEIDLFKPSEIDHFTDYRYYTLDQLPRIHSIMALKELGLSLEQIADLTSDNLPPEQIRGMYRLKQAETQQRVREEQARLGQIEFRLRQIEREGMMQTVDVVIKKIEPIHALTLRRIFRSWQERDQVANAIAAAITQGLIKPNGDASIAIFYEEEFREDTDTEVCVPVDSTHPPMVSLGEAGTLTLRELPAIEAAATYFHEGNNHDRFNEKHLFLQRWALENGYKLGGVWRLRFHRGPQHQIDPSEWLTELQYPIERA